MTYTLKTCAALALLFFLAVPAWAGKPPSCSDVPVEVIFAPAAAGHRISGDGRADRIYSNPADPAFDGGTIYRDGADSLYVQFQICNGTNDLIIRATRSKRYMNFDFAERLTPAAPGAIDVEGQVLQEQFFNVNQVANDSLYVGGQFRTCMGTSLFSIVKGQTGHLVFKDPATYEDQPGGVPHCDDGAVALIANQDGPTSQVLATRLDACTWTIEPVLDATSHYRGGLVEQVQSNAFVNGGQFNMPFRIKVRKLGCTP